jgi:hypothetical protein
MCGVRRRKMRVRREGIEREELEGSQREGQTSCAEIRLVEVAIDDHRVTRVSTILWFPRLCNYNGDRSLPQRGLTLKQCFRRGVCWIR